MNFALKYSLVVYCLISCCSCATENSDSEKIPDRPNIVIFYADDLGWMDLGVQGSDFYESPNIDRIGNEGMRFTRGYANAANCAPSRASLMTGQYTPRHSIYTVVNSFRGKTENRKLIPIQTEKVLDTTMLTLPGYLKDQGYRTCIAGKWHLSPNASDYDFDENFGGHHSGGPKSYFSPYKNPQLSDGEDGEHLPERLSRDVSGWITQQSEPFFVYLPFYSVHTPLQAREDLEALYGEKNAGKYHDHITYAAMIHAMDSAVGTVMAALSEKGVLDETLIIFTSDNGGYGPATSQRPLRGSKGMFYEGGIRIPFMVRWPGKVEAGSICETPVIGSDIFPTLIHVLDGRENEDLDGESILPLLSGGEMEERALHWHFPAYLQMYRKDRAFGDSHDQPHWRSTPQAVVQRGDWKLIEFFEDGDLELYNLAEDIGEQTDLSEAEPARVKELQEEMRKWRAEVGAALPVEVNPEYVR